MAFGCVLMAPVCQSPLGARWTAPPRDLRCAAGPGHAAYRQLLSLPSLLDSEVLEQATADDHLLDLGGALADEQHRCLAVESLDLVLLGVAVAAVDAEALLHHVGAVLG